MADLYTLLAQIKAMTKQVPPRSPGDITSPPMPTTLLGGPAAVSPPNVPVGPDAPAMFELEQQQRVPAPADPSELLLAPGMSGFGVPPQRLAPEAVGAAAPPGVAPGGPSTGLGQVAGPHFGSPVDIEKILSSLPQIPEIPAPPERPAAPEGWRRVLGIIANAMSGLGGGPPDLMQQLQERQFKRQLENWQLRHGSVLERYGLQTQRPKLESEALQNEMMKRRLGMMGGGMDTRAAIEKLGELEPDEQALLSVAQQEAALKGDATPVLQAVGRIFQQRQVGGRAGQSYITEDAASRTGFSRVQKDRTGNIIGVDQHVVVPGAIPKETVRTQLVKNERGQWIEVPVHQVTRPVGPGTRGAVPGTAPVAEGGQRMPVSRAILSDTPVEVVDPATGRVMHQPMSIAAKNTLFNVDAALGMANRLSAATSKLPESATLLGELKQTGMMRALWAAYSHGIDPGKVPGADPTLAAMIPLMALLQIVGSQPYLRNIRRYEFIQQIQQHIPNPERDSVSQIAAKIRTLQRNLPQMVAALYRSEGIEPELEAQSAKWYLQMAGGDRARAEQLAQEDGWVF